MNIIAYLRGLCNANPDRFNSIFTLIFLGILILGSVIAEIRSHVKYHKSLFF